MKSWEKFHKLGCLVLLQKKQHKNSDIDIAIVLKDDVLHTFDTEVQLMTIRKGDETLIEPHTFTKGEFDKNLPMVNQILKYGEKITI